MVEFGTFPIFGPVGDDAEPGPDDDAADEEDEGEDHLRSHS